MYGKNTTFITPAKGRRWRSDINFGDKKDMARKGEKIILFRLPLRRKMVILKFINFFLSRVLRAVCALLRCSEGEEDLHAYTHVDVHTHSPQTPRDTHMHIPHAKQTLPYSDVQHTHTYTSNQTRVLKHT